MRKGWIAALLAAALLCGCTAVGGNPLSGALDTAEQAREAAEEAYQMAEDPFAQNAEP